MQGIVAAPDAGSLHPAAEGGGALLRVAASCPHCGSRPALRVTPALAAAVRERPADERLGTYQCQRRRCGAVYPVRARHLRDAG